VNRLMARAAYLVTFGAELVMVGMYFVTGEGRYVVAALGFAVIACAIWWIDPRARRPS